MDYFSPLDLLSYFLSRFQVDLHGNLRRYFVTEDCVASNLDAKWFVGTCDGQKEFVVSRMDFERVICSDLADFTNSDRTWFRIDNIVPRQYTDLIEVNIQSAEDYEYVVWKYNISDTREIPTTKPKIKSQKKKQSRQEQALEMYHHLHNLPEQTMVLVVDVEWLESDKEKILEIGWAAFPYSTDEDFLNLAEIAFHPKTHKPLKTQERRREKRKEGVAVRHFLVEENFGFYNLNHIEDKRNNFLFGNSYVLNKQKIKTQFDTDFNALRDYGEVVIAGHGVKQDLLMLRMLGIDPKTLIFDTEVLHRARNLEDPNSPKLERMCRILEVCDYGNFHNAGNDAYYTALCVQRYLELPIEELELEENKEMGEID